MVPEPSEERRCFLNGVYLFPKDVKKPHWCLRLFFLSGTLMQGPHRHCRSWPLSLNCGNCLLMPPSVSWKGRISSITGKAVTVCQLLALRQFCWTKENAKPPQKWFLLLVYKLRAVSIGRKPGRYFMVKGLYWVLSSGSWSSNAFAWLWVKQSKERREARLFPKCKILLSCQL